MDYQAKLDKVKPIIEKLIGFGNGSLFVDLLEAKDPGVRISYFPPQVAVPDCIRYLLSLCGTAKKGQDGTMEGITADGVTVVLFGVLRCEIVGFEEIKVPVTVETGAYKIEKKAIKRCVSLLDGAYAIPVVDEVPF